MWLKTKLLPKLAAGDVIVMDNLKAHHDSRVVRLYGARHSSHLLAAVTLRTSIQSSRVGRCRSSTSADSHHAIAETLSTCRAPRPSIASRRLIVAIGSLTARYPELDPGDLWG